MKKFRVVRKQWDLCEIVVEAETADDARKKAESDDCDWSEAEGFTCGDDITEIEELKEGEL